MGLSALPKVDVPCPVCKSVKYRVMYPDTLGERLPEFGYDFSPRHNDSYQVVRCEGCGHAYCSPVPKDIDGNYADVEDPEYLKNSRQRINTAEKVVPVIRRFKPAGTLLDVGCATGDFLGVASRYFAVEGLELSNWAAQIASRGGFTVHRMRLSDLRTDARYDAVTLWGVIEHFDDPGLEIGEIHRLLRPGGVVCLWTGDVDSMLSRLLGRRWWYVQGQHIQLFSRRSIDKLFVDRGFARRAMLTYPYVMTLRSLAKSLGRYRILGAAARALLDNATVGEWKVTFRLPGEMLAIYEKI